MNEYLVLIHMIWPILSFYLSYVVITLNGSDLTKVSIAFCTFSFFQIIKMLMGFSRAQPWWFYRTTVEVCVSWVMLLNSSWLLIKVFQKAGLVYLLLGILTISYVFILVSLMESNKTPNATYFYYYCGMCVLHLVVGVTMFYSI